MRIIRFIDDIDETHYGRDLGNGRAQVLTGSISDGFQATSTQRQIRKLLAPLIPRDIVCIGRNYHASSQKDGSRAQTLDDANLEVFLKPSTALQNPNDPILIPRFDGVDAQLDCEGELAIIIGRTARNVSESDALNCIFGYTLANDVTARHFQTPAGPPIWMRGKGFDTFCPLGPAIITVDEIPDPNNLDTQTTINDQVTRCGSTSQMIRSVPQIIAALSGHMTLHSGTLVLTGAPQPSAPMASLRPKDRVAVEIDQLGLKLENVVLAGAR